MKKQKAKITIFISFVMLLASLILYSNYSNTEKINTAVLKDSPLKSVYIKKDNKFQRVGSVFFIKKGDQFKIKNDTTSIWIKNNKVFTATDKAEYDKNVMRWTVKAK